MSDLRTAALRALEVLEDWESPVALPAIVDLRAALVEDAMQKFTDVNQELEAALAAPIIQPEIKDDKPFGYFRAEPFGWTDCSPTDEGAIPLYTKPGTKEDINPPLQSS